jgi:hypothetical protein
MVRVLYTPFDVSPRPPQSLIMCVVEQKMKRFLYWVQFNELSLEIA